MSDMITPRAWKGWIPDGRTSQAQSRDLLISSLLGDAPQDLRAEDIDLRPFSVGVHSQKQTSSCVAQAIVKALEICTVRDKGVDAHEDLSVLALYYYAREMRGREYTTQDIGTYIAHAMYAINHFGVPAENSWPFRIDKRHIQPPMMVMRRGFSNRIDGYYAIKSHGSRRTHQILSALKAGHPVVFGTKTGKSWVGYKGGVLDPPQQVRGGHAMCIVGWSSEHQAFWVENSWGRLWGVDGCGLMSPALIEHELSRDFWVITRQG